MEEKPNSPFVPASQAVAPEAAQDSPEEHLGLQDGLKIARDALVREVLRYGGQAAIVILLLGGIVYAGYWSFGEMRSLPEFIDKISLPFRPPSQPQVAHSTSTSTLAPVEKPALHAPVKKHHFHVRPLQIAAKVPKRPHYFSAEDPHGGHIIYSDGMITQYSWDK